MYLERDLCLRLATKIFAAEVGQVRQMGSVFPKFRQGAILRHIPLHVLVAQPHRDPNVEDTNLQTSCVHGCD